MLTLNASAPAFSLPDQDGKVHTLHDYAGKWLIVYFYPRDNTPGCTVEACSFRDASHDFKEIGVEILGISKDTVRKHKNFATKHHLNFPLLSDVSTETIKAFGAWGARTFWGRKFEGTLRNTYIIDPQGKVVKMYEKVNPLIHVEEIIEDIRELQKK